MTKLKLSTRSLTIVLHNGRYLQSGRLARFVAVELARRQLGMSSYGDWQARGPVLLLDSSSRGSGRLSLRNGGFCLTFPLLNLLHLLLKLGGGRGGFIIERHAPVVAQASVACFGYVGGTARCTQATVESGRQDTTTFGMLERAGCFRASRAEAARCRVLSRRMTECASWSCASCAKTTGYLRLRRRVVRDVNSGSE